MYMYKRKELKKVGVILKGSSPTLEEEEIIDSLGRVKILLCNGYFAVASTSERIVADGILNLSGKEDLDEFYKDILIEIPVSEKEPEQKVKEVVKKPATKQAKKKEK